SEDGSPLEPGTIFCRLKGLTRAILSGERLALNLLCHLSGIATMTQRLVKLIEGTGARILDTRKTTPLWRDLEKYAVRTGGGVNHRMGLYDMVLIKDNHIRASGGIRNAIRKAKEKARP
ncbi:MAG: nicotinate-nucleotide diphosphorylase, partial [bacterium]